MISAIAEHWIEKLPLPAAATACASGPGPPRSASVITSRSFFLNPLFFYLAIPHDHSPVVHNSPRIHHHRRVARSQHAVKVVIHVGT